MKLQFLRSVRVIIASGVSLVLTSCFGFVEQRPEEWAPPVQQPTESVCPDISGHYQSEYKDATGTANLGALVYTDRALDSLTSSVEFQLLGNDHLRLTGYDPYKRILGERSYSRNAGDFKCTDEGLLISLENSWLFFLISALHRQETALLNRTEDGALVVKSEVQTGGYHAFVPLGSRWVFWARFEKCCTDEYQKRAEEQYINASRIAKEAKWRRITPSYIKRLTPAGLRKQAEIGDPQAQLQLYWEPDEPDRLVCLYRSADQGDANAQYRLGLLYRYGSEGLRQTYTWSYVWYQLAQSNGLWSANREIGALTKLMSSTQLLEAERLLKQWQPGQCARELATASSGN